jgi:hypothetical protein
LVGDCEREALPLFFAETIGYNPSSFLWAAPGLREAGAFRHADAWGNPCGRTEVGMALKVGDAAPHFKIPCSTGELQGEFELASNRDKNLVLAFYALDFTPV